MELTELLRVSLYMLHHVIVLTSNPLSYRRKLLRRGAKFVFVVEVKIKELPEFDNRWQREYAHAAAETAEDTAQ